MITEINYGPSCSGGGAIQNINENINNISIIINVADDTVTIARKASGMVAAVMRTLGFPAQSDHATEFTMIQMGEPSEEFNKGYASLKSIFSKCNYEGLDTHELFKEMDKRMGFNNKQTNQRGRP